MNAHASDVIILMMLSAMMRRPITEECSLDALKVGRSDSLQMVMKARAPEVIFLAVARATSREKRAVQRAAHLRPVRRRRIKPWRTRPSTIRINQ